jgi:GDP-L-fucose synthase
VEAASPIVIIGQSKMYGQALDAELRSQGFSNILPEPDYRIDADMDHFFEMEHPEFVFIVGGMSGGIQANQKYPVDLIRDNLAIVQNVIPSAHVAGVGKLLYLASSCVYPRECKQPMEESLVMTGELEPTNHAYATSKLAGLAMVKAYRDQYNARFISAIPTNTYGPGDAFDAENSHVVASLMRRMDEAKAKNAPAIDIWGTGQPKREFMHVDDLAKASIFMMNNYDDDTPLNIGCGESMTIASLAEIIKNVVGYSGELKFDTSKPDGMPQKVLDSSRINQLGWEAETKFEEGIQSTYEWYRKNIQ